MPKLNNFAFPSIPLCGALTTLAMLFLMGGSSREDTQSLAILNPAMIVCCGAALITLRQEHLSDRKMLACAAGAVVFLAMIYLAPLPLHFEILNRGANEVADIRDATNVKNSPQMLAIAPHAARGSLFFLFAPLAVLLFCLQLDRDDLRRTLPFVVIVGSISGVIGVLQLSGSVKGPLYLYRITNDGAAVGLFANRNHAAVFLACLFPILAVFAARSPADTKRGSNTPTVIAIAVGVVMVPLILVTGSRSGMLAAAVGMIGGMLVYNSHVVANGDSKKRKKLVFVSVISVLVSLVFATVYFSRAEAINRIFAGQTIEFGRIEFWSSSLKLFWQYFPFGFGPGAFVAAFQYDESSDFLNGTYLNRLHNDWLETVLTFGVPGVLLLICAITYYVRRTYLLWFRMDGKRTAVATGRMASIILAILGVASASDYPLRTPALMGFVMLVLIWFIGTERFPDRTTDNSSMVPRGKR